MPWLRWHSAAHRAHRRRRELAANFDWPLHNLDIRNSRYAPLDEINGSNVARLAVKWSYDAGAVDNIGRNTPLVVDGVMYVDAGSKLFAVDAATGRLLWNVQIDPPFPATGRGPIYGDGRIYAYGQSILYAIDAKIGPHRRIVRQQRTAGDRACRDCSSSTPTRTRPVTS